MKDRVVIMMGSSKDEEFTKPIRSTLKALGLSYELHVASAHKTPERILEILEQDAGSEDRIVYITVAGRSNALSGLVDANTHYPVIACPPLGDSLAIDLYSSLRMPSGVAPLVILQPESAALACAKIFALWNATVRERVLSHQKKMKDKLMLDEEKLRGTVE
jgi:5-(carboxyamino)imidazole ribonucleotide mutase